MDLSFLTNYISPLILAVCIGIGYSLHALNNKILNSFLPIISGTIGVIAAVWSLGTFDLPTIVTGLISGLAATGMYEALKNILRLPETYQSTLIQIPYGDSYEDDEEEDDEVPTGAHFAR